MGYRPGLDGVRALAVVAVLAFHDGRIEGGYLGVSAFFTLSGFLITLLLLTEREQRGAIGLRTFFGRRIRRLMPAAIAGIVLAAVVTPATAGALGAPAFRGDALAAAANIANWRFVVAGDSYADLFAAPSALTHYWSLAVEEQFYLVLAPLTAALLALGRGRRAVLATGLGLAAAGSVALGVVLAEGSLDRAYYGTDTRAAEFLIGGLMAIAYGRQVVRRIAVAVGPVALVVLVVAAVRVPVGATGLFRGGLVLHALAAAIVVVAACEPGPVRALCSLPPLRAVGRISYGVYVYHWPLFLVFDTTPARIAATTVVATGSYFLLERPIREQRLPKLAARVMAPAGVLAVVAIVAIAAARIPPPSIVFEPATSAASVRPRAPDPGPARVPSTGEANPSGIDVTRGRLLVVGDSVALTLGRGIERWGAANGVQVRNGGALGCTLLDDADVRGYWGTRHRPSDPCQTARTWPTALAEFDPHVVVVLFGAWDVYDASWDGGTTWHAPGDPEWNRRYEARVADAQRRLMAAGARVLWLAPPCFAAPGDPDEGREWYDPARVAVHRSVAERAATQTGAVVSRTLAERGCPVDLSSRPDGVHFSDPGADAAAGALASEMRSVLLPVPATGS